MTTRPANSEEVAAIALDWLKSKGGKAGPSRNMVGAGLVVFDQMIQRGPVPEKDLLTARGELVGARSGLAALLTKYGLPASYLKEVTTRQASHDATDLIRRLSGGEFLKKLGPEERLALLKPAIDHLVAAARKWLDRQHLKVPCDRADAPTAWIGEIIDQASGRSGGIVEQHLVGAKLEAALGTGSIENHPGHAGDVQTGRLGDFSLGQTVFHVTAAPSQAVLAKCAENLRAGLRPILLVPRLNSLKARHLAEEAGLEKRVMITPIEDFVAINIVEMAKGKDVEYLKVMRTIVDVYNRRLGEVETDMSLRIEIL